MNNPLGDGRCMSRSQVIGRQAVKGSVSSVNENFAINPNRHSALSPAPKTPVDFLRWLYAVNDKGIFSGVNPKSHFRLPPLPTPTINHESCHHASRSTFYVLLRSPLSPINLSSIPLTTHNMAPNIQRFERLPVPEEDNRIRCALLGCGMVRSFSRLFVLWEGHRTEMHRNYLIFFLMVFI
jgi:hypothetical protein